MKVVSVVGVRPQFIKLSTIVREFKKSDHQHIIVHTGQHYDVLMSDIFLKELELGQPNYSLHIGSGTHAEQTGRMLIEIEAILFDECPDFVIVFGDTNSTLAGALAASKLKIPIVHVEAGLRSYNRDMPEEINRIITDHVSSLLLSPTEIAVDNLRKEGITKSVYWVGDVMYDAARYFNEKSLNEKSFLKKLQIQANKYLLVTIHRAAMTDSSTALSRLLNIFSKIDEPIIFPIHPRTRNAIKSAGLKMSENLQVIDPVSYFDMLTLEKNARMILTDSGGVQKEAYFFGVPCLTLRNETEWGELVTAGWNQLVGLDSDRINACIKSWHPTGKRPNFFGSGRAAENIVKILEEF